MGGTAHSRIMPPHGTVVDGTVVDGTVVDGARFLRDRARPSSLA
jgi:hypothetical protein